MYSSVSSVFRNAVMSCVFNSLEDLKRVVDFEFFQFFFFFSSENRSNKLQNLYLLDWELGLSPSLFILLMMFFDEQ